MLGYEGLAPSVRFELTPGPSRGPILSKLDDEGLADAVMRPPGTAPGNPRWKRGGLLLAYGRVKNNGCG